MSKLSYNYKCEPAELTSLILLQSSIDPHSYADYSILQLIHTFGVGRRPDQVGPAAVPRCELRDEDNREPGLEDGH